MVSKLVTNSFLTVSLVALLMTGVIAPVETARADNGTDVKQLVQMPVAVAKFNEAGVPDDELEGLVSALNEAGVTPRNINLILFNLPLFAEDLGSLRAVTNFVVMQHERGLEGEKLASAVKDELRVRGLLAESPLPISESYLDDRLEKIIKTVKRRERERRRRDEPPEQPEEGAERRRQGPPPAPSGPTGPTGPGGQPGGFP